MFFKSNSNYELDISATYEKLPNRTLCSRHRKKQDQSYHSIDTGFESSCIGFSAATISSTSSAVSSSNNNPNYFLQSQSVLSSAYDSENQAMKRQQIVHNSRKLCEHETSYEIDFENVKSVTSSLSTVKNRDINNRQESQMSHKTDDLITDENKSCGDSDSTCSEIESIKTEEFSEVFNQYFTLTDENLKLHELSQQTNQKNLKKIAGIPIKSFDPKNIDSDLDTIKSEMIRDKFKEFKLKSQKITNKLETENLKRSKSSDNLSKSSSSSLSAPPTPTPSTVHKPPVLNIQIKSRRPIFGFNFRSSRFNNTNLKEENTSNSLELTTNSSKTETTINNNNNNNNTDSNSVNNNNNNSSNNNNKSSSQDLSNEIRTNAKDVLTCNSNSKINQSVSSNESAFKQSIAPNHTCLNRNNKIDNCKSSQPPLPPQTSRATASTTQNQPATTIMTSPTTSPYKLTHSQLNITSPSLNNKYINKSYRAERLLRTSDKSPEIRYKPPLFGSSSLTRARSFNPALFSNFHNTTMHSTATTGLEEKRNCNMMQQQLIDYSVYADQVNKYREDLSNSKSELLRTKIKKESLETEIELLENQIKQKKGELRHSFTSLNECDYDFNPSASRLNQSIDTSKQLFSSKMYSNKPESMRHPFSYDDVMKLISERDVLRHKLYYEKNYNKETEKKVYEPQVNQTKEELLTKEQKTGKDKVNKLEDELEAAKKRLEETVSEKDNLVSKVNNLETRLVEMQHDLNKKERDNYNHILAENTEKHLTSLCQTLTSQIEDLRLQHKQAEEKCKRLESDQLIKFDKFETQTLQIENLKKELELNNEAYERLKRNLEEQTNLNIIKEKETNETTNRLLKEKDDSLTDLRLQLAEAKNMRYNNQELHDALIQDFKKTISKQDDEIRCLEEALKIKQTQFETFQREFEAAVGPRVDERIRNEKILWEQEQNFLIRRELSKLNEEKSKEITKIQDELNSEKEKSMVDRDKCLRLEKEIEELNQEIKFANKEKTISLTKAKESLRLEAEKIKIDAYNEKQDEINKLKRIIKDYEDEIQRLKIEQQQNVEKDREFIINVEKLEKNLIKEINEEQRKLSSLIPGIMPKLVNYSNLRSIYSVKNVENALTLNTFQIAFSNLKNLLEEVTQSYQNLKSENEQTKRNIHKVCQDKEESIEAIKRQYERQKQKELETIREYVSKDSDSMNNYTNEVSSLVSALKNKDREIQEIQENMSGWKKDTLAKLAEKFEVELNKELDRRMQEHKVETNNQQMQLDKIRKEMDSLIKEYRHSNQNQISQEQHERMVRYLQSRLNDLRDENLTLRERFKSSNYLQQHMGYLNTTNTTKSMSSEVDYANMSPQHSIGSVKNDLQDDENINQMLYTPSLDGEDHLESKNELLQQKLNELQKLQIQLNNVKS